jgi:hypothetical protein
MKKEKINNFSAEIYQLRRIINKLINIYAILKNIVNHYFVISILLPINY